MARERARRRACGMDLGDLFVRVAQFLRDQEIVRLKREAKELKEFKARCEDLSACVKMPFFSRLMLDVHRQRLEYGQAVSFSFPGPHYDNSLYSPCHAQPMPYDDPDDPVTEEIRVPIPCVEDFKCILRVLPRLGFTVAMRDTGDIRDFYVFWDCETELARPDIDTVNPFVGLQDIILPLIKRESVQTIGHHTDVQIAEDQAENLSDPE